MAHIPLFTHDVKLTFTPNVVVLMGSFSWNYFWPVYLCQLIMTSDNTTRSIVLTIKLTLEI